MKHTNQINTLFDALKNAEIKNEFLEDNHDTIIKFIRMNSKI